MEEIWRNYIKIRKNFEWENKEESIKLSKIGQEFKKKWFFLHFFIVFSFNGFNSQGFFFANINTNFAKIEKNLQKESKFFKNYLKIKRNFKNYINVE